jgi:hypothetical protein
MCWTPYLRIRLAFTREHASELVVRQALLTKQPSTSILRPHLLGSYCIRPHPAAHGHTLSRVSPNTGIDLVCSLVAARLYHTAVTPLPLLNLSSFIRHVSDIHEPPQLHPLLKVL